MFTAGFLEGIDLAEPVAQQRKVWEETSSATQTNKELAFDWRYTLAECDLPKVVGTTTLAGIDVGFPMLDADLLAFSMRLPTEYKLKGLKLRWFFKEALRGFLPDEILTKKKQGLFMALGTPIVVASTRIDKHYFDDSLVRFFAPGDERDLARQMLDSYRDRERSRRLSQNALDYAKKMSWANKRNEYMQIVSRLAGAR